MSSLHPVIVRIDTEELAQSDEDPIDYLSTLVFNMMYQNDISHPKNEPIINSYRYMGNVPLSSYFPPQTQSTLYDSGIDFEQIGERLLTESTFKEQYMWDDLQLKIELTNNTCKFVLRAAENAD